MPSIQAILITAFMVIALCYLLYKDHMAGKNEK